MHTREAVRFTAVAATLALALAPSAVLGSGFQLLDHSASGLGNAFSGQAAGAQDASAIFFNPALLTRLEGGNLVISAVPVVPSNKFIDGGSTSPSLPPGLPPLNIPLGNDGGDAGGLTPVPAAFFSYQVAETWWLGLGVNVPFGLTTEWDSQWLGRFHGIKSSIHAINVNPTVAVKLGVLSIGLGANWQQFDAELTQNTAYGGASYLAGFDAGSSIGGPALGAQVAGGIAAQLPNGLATEGLTVLDGDSTKWGWNAGITIDVAENARLGVSYRSEIKHDLEGTIAFNDVPTFRDPVNPMDLVGIVGQVLNDAFAGGPITAGATLPDTLSVALAWEGETVEVMADWTRTGWSSIPSLDVLDADGEEVTRLNLQFEDTWKAGVGVNVRLSEPVKLRLGVAYDKSPVQDEFRTPRLPDNHRTWLAGGFEWRLNEKHRFDIGYAHLLISDASSNLVADNPADPDFIEELLRGNLVGTYQSNVNIFAVQYTLGFGF